MNSIKTTLLLTSLTLLLLFIGKVLGGSNGMVMALVFAAIMNIGAYWFSDSIVLRMYNAQQIGPRDHQLYSIVEDLAARARIPMPKVYIINDQAPNAFATGRNPEHAAVAATTGILQLLTRDELTGVMAHELTHVTNRDTLISAIAATIGGAIGMLANMAQYAAMFGGHRNQDGENNGSIIGSILMMILAPIAASLIQMAVSRSREYLADEGGARLCGDPLSLARALEKLESLNQRVLMPVAEHNPATAHMFIINPLKSNWRGLFSTHPLTSERVKRLKEMRF